MSDEAPAIADVAPVIPSAQVETPPSDDKMLSVREAARLLQSRRKRPEQAPAPAVETPTEENLAQQANAEPQETAPISETTEQVEPQEIAPIDAPVSWTAEDKERFQSLPREVQEIVSNRERDRDAEVRRRQNEFADRLKALEPEALAMQQARAQYEQALPAVLQTLQSTGEWADIRTMEDAERLANDDWPRYVRWDAHTKKVAAVQQEVQAAQYRQQQEYSAQWQNYASEQDRMFAEKVPEFADDTKREALQKLTIDTLEKDYGFTPQEMAFAWNGAFRDHRVQQLLLDAAKYRQLKKNPPKPAAKPLPPVQRPGVSAPQGGLEYSTEIKALEKKSSLSWKDAARLHQLRRQAKG